MSLLVEASVVVDEPAAEPQSREWFDALVRGFIGTLEAMLDDGCADGAIDWWEDAR